MEILKYGFGLWLLIAGGMASGEPSGEPSENRRFSYQERDHEAHEMATHVGVTYAAAWMVYPVTQPAIYTGEKGSWVQYRKDFGRLVYDQDEPFWNWMVHPLSGSQLYLFYRGMGYDSKSAFGMTTLSSALFEFTVEVYSEPASIQDLYQTPVFGSLLGMGIEEVSVELLNSGSPVGEFFGRVINPTSYFMDPGPLKVVPLTDFNRTFGISVMGEL